MTLSTPPRHRRLCAFALPLAWFFVSRRKQDNGGRGIARIKRPSVEILQSAG